VVSTPRQIALHRALGFAPPRFAHVPLLLTGQGERLAKRTRPSSIAAMRERGMDPVELVGRLACSAGLCEAGARLSPAMLLARIPSQRELWSRLSHAPAIWDHEPASADAHGARVG
jgi:glutamyl-tRNA synthetase